MKNDFTHVKNRFKDLIFVIYLKLFKQLPFKFNIVCISVLTYNTVNQ